MDEAAYAEGVKEGIRMAVNFIDSLPEEEMEHVPPRALVRMIRLQIERLTENGEMKHEAAGRMFIRILDAIYNMDKVNAVNIEGKEVTMHFTNGKGVSIQCDSEKQAKTIMDFCSSRVVLPGNDFVVNCRLASMVIDEGKDEN